MSHRRAYRSLEIRSMKCSCFPRSADYDGLTTILLLHLCLLRFRYLCYYCYFFVATPVAVVVACYFVSSLSCILAYTSFYFPL